MMAMTREPFKEALRLAGRDEPNAYYYQDYLYELMHDNPKAQPITEQQWETLCDLKGNRVPVYASTVKHMLINIAAEKKEA